jgi:hypothetical protein
MAGRRLLAIATVVRMDISGDQPASVRRLTIGASGGTKATMITLAIMLLCLLGFAASIVTALGSFLSGGADAGFPTLVGVVVGVLFFLGAAGLLAGSVLKVWRTAYWIEGTTLVHRAALRTRRVDLATADVAGDTIVASERSGNNSWRTVTSAAIRAHDRRTGVVIKAPVRTPGRGRLPSNELVALADAIMQGRRADDPGYASAEAVASRLRELAADPFPV